MEEKINKYKYKSEKKKTLALKTICFCQLRDAVMGAWGGEERRDGGALSQAI